MGYKKLTTPFTNEMMDDLKAGDKVLISGEIFTARDAAHKRIVDSIYKNEELPFELNGQCIYYVGPCPAKDGEVIGPCGPTSSYRQDAYTPTILENGVKGMIGKGLRNEEVIQSMIKNHATYFVAVGGAAALIADCVKKVEMIAYEDLGSEAVRKLTVENLNVIVAIDNKGNNLYESEPKKFQSN